MPGSVSGSNSRLIKRRTGAAFFTGRVTAVPGANQFTVPELAGLGAGFFSDAKGPYYARVVRDAGGAGALPQGEQRIITGYVTGTGVFTTLAFGAAVGIGDEVEIIVPTLATRFDEAVWVDSILGVAGTGYSNGTAQNPSNSLADARTMLAERKQHTIRFTGSRVLDADMTDIIWDGTYPIAGGLLGIDALFSIDGCYFRGMQLQGDAHLATVDAIGAEECSFFITANPITLGFAKKCYLATLPLYLTGSNWLIDCVGGEDVVIGGVIQRAVIVATPTAVNIFIQNWTGALELQGVNHADAVVSIGGTGSLYIDPATCLLGRIYVYGDIIINGGGGGVTVIDKTQAAQNKLPHANTVDMIINTGAPALVTDDGSAPQYDTVAVSTENAAPPAAMSPLGTILLTETVNSGLSVFDYFRIDEVAFDIEWATKLTVGAGDATKTYSQLWISDGAGTMVAVSDVFEHINAAYTTQIRKGRYLASMSIPFLPAPGGFSLYLFHWTNDSVGGAGRSTSEGKLRLNSVAKVTYSRW